MPQIATQVNKRLSITKNASSLKSIPKTCSSTMEYAEMIPALTGPSPSVVQPQLLLERILIWTSVIRCLLHLGESSFWALSSFRGVSGEWAGGKSGPHRWARTAQIIQICPTWLFSPSTARTGLIACSAEFCPSSPRPSFLSSWSIRHEP
jgi:hypothetical protein